MNEIATQIEAATKLLYAKTRRGGTNEIDLDDEDAGLVRAAVATHPHVDHLPLLVLADKLQEDGHEDLAHLIRHGVERGRVTHSRIGVTDSSYHPPMSATNWRTDDSFGGWSNGPLKAVTTFWVPHGATNVAVHIHTPTAEPDIREAATRVIGLDSHSNDYWKGVE